MSRRSDKKSGKYAILAVGYQGQVYYLFDSQGRKMGESWGGGTKEGKAEHRRQLRKDGFIIKRGSRRLNY